MQKFIFLFSLMNLLCYIGLSQTPNTLDKLGLSSGSPAQVAYSMRRLSTAYSGPAIKVRRSTDAAEATVAFSGDSVTSGSTVTLTPGVNVNASLGTLRTESSINTVAAKSGTITIAVNKPGNISVTSGSNLVTGASTNFIYDLAAGDILYRSSDNALIGVVKTISTATSLILNNNTVTQVSGAAFKNQDAIVTGSGTAFTSELANGDRIYKSSDNSYLGTVKSRTTSTSMILDSRDAVAVTPEAISFSGTLLTITGTLFTSGDVNKMLISNNVTIGTVATFINSTSVTLTTKAGAAISGSNYKVADGSMPFSTFYASADVFVTTWYDQSGYGRDAVQYDITRQPQLVSAGTMKRVNGRPALYFSSKYLQTSSAASWLTNTLYTQNIVTAEVIPMPNYRFVLSTSGGNGGPTNTIMHYGYRSPSQYTVAQYSNDVNFEVFATNSLELHTSVKYAINTSQLFHNGDSLGKLTSSAGSHMRDLGLLNIGYYMPTSNFYSGYVSELTVYAVAMGWSDRRSMETNQLSFYGISTANWTGTTDSDWTKTTNWSPQVVPTATSPALVVIPNVTNKPVISGTSPALNIHVLSGSSLTITGTLELYGTLSTTANNCIATSGTVEYKAAGAQTIVANTFSANTVKNLTINTANLAMVSMGGDLKITGELRFTNNRLFIQYSSLTLDGTVTNTYTGGLRGNSNASLVVTGTPTLSFDQSGSGSTNILKNLTINNSVGGTVSLANNLVLASNGTLAFTKGKLDITGKTLTIQGAVTNTVNEGIKSTSTGNLTVEGTTNRTLSFDQTSGNKILNNLTIATTSANTVSINNPMQVNGTLTVNAGQTLNLGTNTLGGTLTTITNNGTITTQNTSSTPIPTDKTWGGTVNYNSTAAAQTAMAGTYNNLTISSTYGATASGNIGVNGILNLAVANPATNNKGCLEMTRSYTNYPGTTISDYLDSYLLNMGATATTLGIGDVTGTIKRSTIVANTPYTFGHQYTTITLTTGTMPTELAVSVTIGTTPGNTTKPDDIIRDAINRTYEIVPTGGSNCYVTANFHYLDDELTSTNDPYHVNTEQKLTTMDYDIDINGHGYPYSDEHGRANYDYTNNYIGLSSVPISYFIQIPGTHEWRTIFTLRDYGVDYYTWNGSVSNVWGTPANWTLSNGGSGVPTELSHVIIPNTSLTLYDPVLPGGNTTINTISIEEGGILTMGSNTLTIQNFFSGGWEDQNPSGNDPGTSTVVFNRKNTTVSGNARFNNVRIYSDASYVGDITNQAGSTMKIAGTITKTGSGTGKWYADLFDNTVEYNKAGNQDLSSLLPDGNGGYHSLTLSGSGTKTMPASALAVHGNLTTSGTVAVAPANTLTIGGNLILGTGTTFTAGSLSHTIGGNFENNSSAFSSTGSTFTFNGTAAQSIGGTTSPATFNNLTISNTAGVTLLNNTTTSALNIGTGSLTVTAAKYLTAGGATTLGSSQCLVLKSDAAGTASFIDNGTISGTGTMLAERYLTPYADVNDYMFHFLSSPVGTSQAIDPEFSDPVNIPYTDFYKWDEPTNMWINYRGSEPITVNADFGTNFETGRGYLVAYPSATTKKFIGAPYTNAGGLTLICTNTLDGGWNLLGNPFPSPIDWDLVSKGNGMDGALYYYDNTAANYRYYVDLTGGLSGGSQYIPAMQGFMVHAKSSGTQTITIGNDDRTPSELNNYYKQALLESNILDLKVSGNGYEDAARICFYDQATAGFDGDFDAQKLWSYNSKVPRLYSRTADGTNVAINTLPVSGMEGTVPVWFSVEIPGACTLTASGVNTFGPGVAITLTDKKTGTEHNLSQNPVYPFTASSGDQSDRFLLTFGHNSIPETSVDKTQIYTYGNRVNIRHQGPLTVELYNLAGQIVGNYSNDGDGLFTLPVNLPTGYYVVRAVDQNTVLTRKVFIHNN
jgi:hypothetical protein